MGLFKEHPSCGEGIDIGCLRLRMATEATDPVVQIIYGKKQNVGSFSRKATDCRCKENAKAQKSRLVKSCGHT